MESRIRQDIVIVVMANKLPVQVHRERPEAVNCYFFTQTEGSTDQEKSCGKPFGMDTFALPELPNVTQEIGVGKKDRLLGTKVLQGVIDA